MQIKGALFSELKHYKFNLDIRLFPWPTKQGEGSKVRD